MKLNLKVRAKNPWFWIGIGAVILSAMGVDPKMFTSWSAVWDAVVALFTNPFKLATVALAVFGVVVDHTTKGASDSERAMKYTVPGGEKTDNK